ncbi:MAG: UDP-glucose 4-epimerase GalE, partial [Candidatus Aminicenantia bacterium]
NLDSLKEIFKKNKFEAVMHFASLSRVEESFNNPEKYYRENIINSLNILDCMVESGPEIFIFSSSASVYGNPIYTPIDEAHPLNPISPYGETKIFVERILEGYSQRYGIKYISLRYFNAAGADPEGELGELHKPETHLIPSLLLHIFGKKDEFIIYGNDYNTKDGTAVRDFIHVSDLAKAHILALEWLLKNRRNQIINLGSGIGFTVKEVLEKVEEITGKEVKVRIEGRRKGDPEKLVASPKKAEELLGWSQKFSTLYTMIRSAWEWLKNNIHNL